MAKDTEYTCAIFFKITGDEALTAVNGDMERIVMVLRSQITQAVEENGTVRGPAKKRYSDEEAPRRLPFGDARRHVVMLPSLKVHRKNKWEDA